MWQRIRIYISEMFPLKVYIPFAFLNHYILFFTVQVYLGAAKPILSFYSLIGVVTIVGFMLMMRIFDELKDTEVDAKLFSSRPFPRGAVLKKDLLTLLALTFVIVVAFNSFRSYTLPFFLISLGYGLLTFKWFFIKSVLSKRLMLALITHQPISWLINVYVASTAMVQVGTISWSSSVFISTIAFFVPVLGWELSRKIKARNAENEYVTYSKVLGFRAAVIVTLFVNLSFSLLLIYLSLSLSLSIYNIVFQGIIAIYLIYQYLRFLIKPIQKHNTLKRTAELQSAIAILVYLIFFISKFGIHFSWY